MRNDLRSDRRPAYRRFHVPPLRMVLAGILAGVLLVALGWWLYDRFVRSDEEKIRGLIHSAAQAARERRPSGVTAILADDFVLHAPWGDFDREHCHGALVDLLMNRFRHIEVSLPAEPIPVTVSPDRQSAQADFPLRVRGKWTDESEWLDLTALAGGTRAQCRFKLGT